MITDGFVLVHRKITQWEWYDDIPVYRLFTHLLYTVNWYDKKWHGIEIKRGQKITSIAKLSNETGLSQKQVRTAINKLKNTGELATKTASKYTLVSVVNYDLYQFDTQERASKRQTEGKQTANKGQQINKAIKQKYKNKKVVVVDKQSDSCVDEIEKFYNDNIDDITPYVQRTLGEYERKMGKELVLFAMQRAIDGKVKNMYYIKAILNSWDRKGIKNLQDAEMESKQKIKKLENNSVEHYSMNWEEIYDN